MNNYKNLALILVHLQCIEDLIIEDKTTYRFEAKRIHNQLKQIVSKLCRKMEAPCDDKELEIFDKARELYWEVDKVIKQKYLL